MARKDRAAARRRHAVERARRESGWEPSSKPEDERPPGSPGRSRPGGSRPGGRPPASPLKKMEVGDVDRRGRVFERPMRLHPKVSLRIYLAVFAVAVLSLFRPELRPLSYFAFSVGMLVIADGQPTRKWALFFVILAGFLFAAGIVLTVAQVTGRVSG
ncbi:MAG TPA: hypothetical protein VG276_20645 [Actinomycetes bacterium]|nr:hypothetical protein [Actinomycetes bacterium]